ncbi:hypothetical protein B0H11DRAFT_899280 [Mycena galericulata]|nr:hypothetical protein B0H11DRAFT_899280 [Mycena galericulata]
MSLGKFLSALANLLCGGPDSSPSDGQTQQSQTPAQTPAQPHVPPGKQARPQAPPVTQQPQPQAPLSGQESHPNEWQQTHPHHAHKPHSNHQQEQEPPQKPPPQHPSPPPHRPDHGGYHYSDPNQVNQHDAHYMQLRAQANEEGAQMAKCFSEGHDAYSRGDGAGAKELSNQGKAHQAKMNSLNKEASDWIFIGQFFFPSLVFSLTRRGRK